jgi:hypothetical protein
MKKNYDFRLWVFVLAVLLTSACAVPYSLVSGHHVATTENFAVDLPQGWRQHNDSADPVIALKTILEKRRKLSWDVIRLTRDGLLLQQIGIGRIALTDELSNTKRKLTSEMLPQEVAEVISDDLRANTNLTQQDIIENSPSVLGGYPGFKLHYTYRSADRLKVEGLFYGAIAGRWLYYVLYEAPAQYYFNKDLVVFERTRATFQILRGAS